MIIILIFFNHGKIKISTRLNLVYNRTYIFNLKNRLSDFKIGNQAQSVPDNIGGFTNFKNKNYGMQNKQRVIKICY